MTNHFPHNTDLSHSDSLKEPPSTEALEPPVGWEKLWERIRSGKGFGEPLETKNEEKKEVVL